MPCRGANVDLVTRNDRMKAHWTVGWLVYPLSILLTILAAAPVGAQTNTTSFSFPDRGGVSITTAGTSSGLGVGHVRITQSGAIGAGFATFGFRRDNVLVSEATVPAADLVSEGRIYAEIGSGVDTGIAFSNPGEVPVDI